MEQQQNKAAHMRDRNSGRVVDLRDYRKPDMASRVASKPALPEEDIEAIWSRATFVCWHDPV